MFDVANVDQIRNKTQHLSAEMFKAMDKADIFLAFVSDHYQHGINANICECEFFQALQTEMKILTVKTGEILQGWLDISVKGLPMVNLMQSDAKSSDEHNSSEILRRIVKICQPEPINRVRTLTASQIGTRKSVNMSQKRMSIGEKFRKALKNLRFRMRTILYGFLLFDCETYVDIFDLSIVWGLADMSSADILLNDLQEKMECFHFNDDNGVMIQQIFYENALEMAFIDCKIIDPSMAREEKLQQLRFKIIQGLSKYNQSKSDPIVFLACHRQHRSFIERIIEICNEDQVREVCLTRGSGKNATFIHFLYNFNWMDDSKNLKSPKYNTKHSYRLLERLLLILINGGRLDFDLFTPRDDFNETLIGDLMADVMTNESAIERQPLLDLTIQYRYQYHELLWRGGIAKDGNNENKYSISEFDGNKAKIEAYVVDTDAEVINVDDNALVTAARLGNVSDFFFLYEQRTKKSEKSQIALDEDGKTSLMYASANGCVRIVDFICQNQREEIEVQDSNGKTALMHASMNGHADCVTILLNKITFQHIKIEDLEGKTAVSYAAMFGHLKCLELLISKHSKAILHRDHSSMTPLLLASFYGHFQCLGFLTAKLEQNLPSSGDFIDEVGTAMVVSANNGFKKCVQYFEEEHLHGSVVVDTLTGRSALMAAAERGHMETVVYLVSSCVDQVKMKDENGYSPMMLAAIHGRHRIVIFLHQICPVSIQWHDNTFNRPLHGAAKNGHLNTVKYLYSQYRDAFKFFNSESKAPIMLAAEGGHVDTVEFLHEKEPALTKQWRDQNAQNSLMLAASSGSLETVKYLVKKCEMDALEKDIEGRDSIMIAALNGNLTIVEFLLEENKNYDMNNRDRNSWTPLMLAAIGGNLDTVELLASKGNLFQNDNLGRNAFHLASLHGNEKCVKFGLDSSHCQQLLASSDDRGATALMMAAENGHLNVIKLIYEKDPNSIIQCDYEGRLPLMFAAEHGHFDCVEFLWNKPNHESVMMRDDNDRTALSLAAANGHDKIVQFLYEKYHFAVNIRDTSGATVLSMASNNGHENVVKFIDSLKL